MVNAEVAVVTLGFVNPVTLKERVEPTARCDVIAPVNLNTTGPVLTCVHVADDATQFEVHVTDKDAPELLGTVTSVGTVIWMYPPDGMGFVKTSEKSY